MTTILLSLLGGGFVGLGACYLDHEVHGTCSKGLWNCKTTKVVVPLAAITFGFILPSVIQWIKNPTF